jgi:hypothetical protein
MTLAKETNENINIILVCQPGKQTEDDNITGISQG